MRRKTAKIGVLLSRGFLRYYFPSLLVFSLGIFLSCTDPGGLESVAGIAGTVQFEAEWPDSLTGAVVVIFDIDLDLDSLDSPDYSVVDHFITFGDPIRPGVAAADYFIQLRAGRYLGMVIGLLIDPARLLADEQLFQDIQKYIVIPENSAPRGIAIQEKQVNEQSIWPVNF